MVGAPKDHALILEVPENGAKGAEEADTEDDVKATQGDGIAVDLELLHANASVDVVEKALAWYLVPISHRHMEAQAV